MYAFERYVKARVQTGKSSRFEQSAAASPEQCGAKCLSRGVCQGFSFTRATKQCLLVSVWLEPCACVCLCPAAPTHQCSACRCCCLCSLHAAMLIDRVNAAQIFLGQQHVASHVTLRFRQHCLHMAWPARSFTPGWAPWLCNRRRPSEWR